MIAVKTFALAVCQNTVINRITSCDEDTNNNVTPAVLFDMTSAPTPFKPGGTQQSFIPGRFCLEVQPLTLCTIFDNKGATFKLKTFIDKCCSFHKPSLELCVPFNCCKCAVF